jgi:hypothetical protein
MFMPKTYCYSLELYSARKILDKFQNGDPSNDLPFQRWHPGFGRSLEQFERDSEKWERLAKEISRRHHSMTPG